MDASSAKGMPGVVMVDEVDQGFYDAVIVAVKHKCFIDMGVSKVRQFCKPNGVLCDLKSAFDKSESDMRL